MTLTFHEIGLRFPDAVVLWDRDVAPALDWEPRFEICHGHLWARDVECEVRGYGRCRCALWSDRDGWSSVAHYPERLEEWPGNRASQSPGTFDRMWRDRLRLRVRRLMDRQDFGDYEHLIESTRVANIELWPNRPCRRRSGRG